MLRIIKRRTRTNQVWEWGETKSWERLMIKRIGREEEDYNTN